MIDINPYKTLAERLDALPNGFPSTDNGIEIRLLAKIFTPEEAALAAQLRLTLETPIQVASRIGGDPETLRIQLKGMVKRGLITAGQTDGGLGYGLMPFVVGIYEMQLSRIDEELARLFEDYYRQTFKQAFSIRPSVHRVIPVQESVRVDMEVHPYESAVEIVKRMQSWGVMDCICRKQKALIGEPCNHPVDNCLMLSEKSGAYDHNPVVRALTQEEALETLQRAAKAGLVHSVSNNQKGIWYVCNCCTCSCGVLRGLAEMGVANIIARSAFVNRVDEILCLGCDECAEYCQFGALTVEDIARVDSNRCVGCGVCVPSCPEEALGLVRRPTEEVVLPPVSEAEWLSSRAKTRGIDMDLVL